MLKRLFVRIEMLIRVFGLLVMIGCIVQVIQDNDDIWSGGWFKYVCAGSVIYHILKLIWDWGLEYPRRMHMTQNININGDISTDEGDDDDESDISMVG